MQGHRHNAPTGAAVTSGCVIAQMSSEPGQFRLDWSFTWRNFRV